MNGSSSSWKNAFVSDKNNEITLGAIFSVLRGFFRHNEY